MNLIEAVALSKCYNEKTKKKVYAVKDVDLAIRKGEILGLVGESGCGKSTLGKMLLQLEKSTGGQVFYGDENISKYDFNKMRTIRNNMQMIFQNSSNLFNPYYTVKQIIMEPINNYSKDSEADKEQRIIDILSKVGLDSSYLERYGNQLSGGQRQRVGIARALVLKPEFVVCDEVVSSVDYEIRNQILKLLIDLKEEFGLTYLFISHDLSAVKKICDRVVVMYMGNIMEILPSIEENIKHPYTKALLAASLDINPRNRQKKKILFRENEEQIIPENGCIFQNRCLYSNEKCKNNKPKLENTEDNHFVACHLYKK
ncbi:ABC transporter ATP-binding protein [Clostridiaceae bacterium UIB06]|uniref:ABC transporter ATP-binding protein n=1 Tax=Clostridium thailandense TaxID=2794346 RepID=A0A949TWR4_9CLOT|nr:ABC transporter ATP-binding protein [Clostridium thailandense]MBV7271844.1 ABC transporter ATP-binding protein [Clostridium thailandense]MCH5136857.1 ABC transporter ATP-binding protein [Clostridiaceae bacterium UIB06]